MIVIILATALAACAVAPPRTDDPLQDFNRKMFAFNQLADNIAIRPVAQAYVKVTGPRERLLIDNFFANIRSPVTIVNDVLQGRPRPALEAGGRFLVNTTLGIAGLFDPASDLHMPAQSTDFGVTLAHWGVPEGPYLVLPFIGPTTLRDVWRLPVDSLLDPLGWYARDHALDWHAQYLPSVAYLVTLRADALPLDPMLDSAFDPYAFLRDAYRQHRLFMIYYGNPPLSAIEQLQGTSAGEESSDEIDALLREQRQYEKTHGIGGHPPASPAPRSSSPAVAPSSSSPAAPASTAIPAPATTTLAPA